MNDNRRWFNYGLNPLSLLTIRMQLEAIFFMNVKYKVLVLVVVEDNLIILHLMLFIFLFMKKEYSYLIIYTVAIYVLLGGSATFLITKKKYLVYSQVQFVLCYEKLK